jgi:AraC-like DNA-binding protein
MDLDLRWLRGDDSSLDEEDGEKEPDLPPEYCHYRDEGCEFADSCLNCRFPQCLYDYPGGRQHWLKEIRNKEISRLFSNGDCQVNELARLFGVSRRTVQRALKSTLLAPCGETTKRVKRLAKETKETG